MKFCCVCSIFRMLCRLYDSQSNQNDVAEVVMARQRVVIDRFIHLLSCGYVQPVLQLVPKMYEEGQIDVSLVRYFGVEVIELVAPPYADEFINGMQPILAKSEIFDRTTVSKHDQIAHFISYCNS